MCKRVVKLMASSFYWSLFGAFSGASMLIVLCIFLIVPHVSRRWRVARRRDTIAEEYQKTVEVRQEAVYHYYWAIERKDFKDADGHEASVLEIDNRLGQLKLDYLSIN